MLLACYLPSLSLNSKQWCSSKIACRNTLRGTGSLCWQSHVAWYGVACNSTSFLERKEHSVARTGTSIDDYQKNLPDMQLYDLFRIVGAVPVSGMNFYKLLRSNAHVALYPGGVGEALHRKGEEYKLFWPEHSEFVRTASRFGAKIIPFGVVGEDDLCEAVFQDKDVIGSDDEGAPGADHNAYLDAATPGIKDAMVGVSEAMPRDAEQAEDLAMNNEFIEDAQAPQTPGLVEVPNSSSVREQLACDDHMEVEDLNSEEGRKASGDLDATELHKRGEDLSSEERAEHVHVTSPCCSHITTEMEDPGQVMTEAGTNVNNVVADKSDAVPPLESPGEENRDHFAIATEVNQETDSSLQGDGQVYSRPDEQLNNAPATDEQLGNLTGFTDCDLPAPEKVLAAPNRLVDGNDSIYAR